MSLRKGGHKLVQEENGLDSEPSWTLSRQREDVSRYYLALLIGYWYVVED